MSKTIAIIPARGGSKRIPRKNIIDFCGKPLIAWSIEQALASDKVDAVYVSTEDMGIKRVAEDYGAIVLDRPVELAQDDTTLEETVLDALKDIECDRIVILQPTSPLRLPGDIDMCISSVLTMCFSSSIERDLYLWSATNPFTFNPHTREMLSIVYLENGSIYCINRDEFFRGKSRYGGGDDRWGIHIQKNWQSHEIDEPEDLVICEALMEEYVI